MSRLCSLFTLSLAVVCTASIASVFATEKEEGFVPLFDGKTTDGWQLVRGKGPGYIIKDGVLICPADGGGNLYTKKEYANFVLRFDFKVEPGGNNGVGLRAPLEGDAAYTGMESQILDDEAPQYANLLPSQYHGSIYKIFAAKRGAAKKAGEWNSEEIVCDGRHVKVTLNGKVIVDGNLDDVKDATILAEHPGIKRTKGFVGFLGHGSHVEFKNIRLKELP